MQFDWILWDEEGDEPNNVEPIAEHGVTPEEVQEVLESVPESRIVPSRSSGRPCVIGETAAGRTLFVAFDYLDIPGMVVPYPVKAFDPED